MKKYLSLLFVALSLVYGCNNDCKQENEELQKRILILQKSNDSLSGVIENKQREINHYKMEIEFYSMNPEKLCANIDELYNDENLSSLRDVYLKLYRYHPESEQIIKVSEYISKLEKVVYEREDKERVEQVKALKEAEEKRLQAVNKLNKEYDDVSGITWYNNPYFTHYNESNYTSIYLGNIEDNRFVKPWLRLKMSYKGDDWLFFKKAFLSYDGNTMEVPFDAYKDRKSDNSGYAVWEWIDVMVDDSILSFLRKMVKGKVVKMRLSGKYTKTRELSSNEIKGIEDVLLGYDVLCEEKKKQ